MLKHILLPEAKADVKEASKWYNSGQADLGKDFYKEVRKTIKYIQQYPEGFEVKYKQFRGCITDRFPYIVFYRIHNQTVVVVAVLATRQDRKILDKR